MASEPEAPRSATPAGEADAGRDAPSATEGSRAFELRRLLRGDLTRAGAVTYGVTALTLAVNLATGILIARTLGAGGRGELAAIMIVPEVLRWVFGLGGLEAIAYRQARNPNDAGRLLTTWFATLVPLSAVAIVVGELLVPVLFAAQTSEAHALAQLYVLTIALVLSIDILYGVVLGDQDFNFFNAMRLLRPLAITILYLALWQLDALSVETALIATAAAGLVEAGMVAWRVLSRHRPARANAAFARSTLWYGLRANGTNVAAVLNARLDLLIIPAFLSASSVGLYSVATNISSIVIALAGALSLIVLPAAARRREQGPRTVIRALHATVGIGIVLAVGLALAGQLLIPAIYGEQFRHSVPLLQILLPGAVLYAAASVLWSGLYAANRPFTATLAQVAGLAVTLTGLLLFLASGGARAAAIVSSVAYATVFALALTLYARATSTPWKWFAPSLGRSLRGPRPSTGASGAGR